MSLLRAFDSGDQSELLALNQANVTVLSPLDAERLGYLLTCGAHVEVIDHRGGFAGFVITFEPGSAYDSANYRWFGERFEEFCYLDRIVLADDVRRIGLGGRVYDAIEPRVRTRMALEVNVDPPNQASLAFHAQRGYVEVGRQGPPGHEVAMLVRELH